MDLEITMWVRLCLVLTPYNCERPWYIDIMAVVVEYGGSTPVSHQR
jgi:hypothetical protein